MTHKSAQVRYRRTLRFLKETSTPPMRILDLGVDNEFSQMMRDEGFDVDNTGGEDLDFDTSSISEKSYDLVTGFEILEHLINPMGVLQSINADKIMMSIPMRLWFARAYRSSVDPWDRHYHEFEDWQFDWLVKKAGWKITRRAKWTSHPSNPFGFRPILRYFTPRYYIIEAVRDNK